MRCPILPRQVPPAFPPPAASLRPWLSAWGVHPRGALLTPARNLVTRGARRVGFSVLRLVAWFMSPVSFFWPAQALRTLANFSRGFAMAEFESVNDALIGAVKALGGSKQVGPLLWPEKAPDAAERLALLDAAPVLGGAQLRRAV